MACITKRIFVRFILSISLVFALTVVAVNVIPYSTEFAPKVGTESRIRDIGIMISIWKHRYRSWPPTDNRELANKLVESELFREEKKNNGYKEKASRQIMQDGYLIDCWGRQLLFQIDRNENFIIRSSGVDGVWNNADDLMLMLGEEERRGERGQPFLDNLPDDSTSR